MLKKKLKHAYQFNPYPATIFFVLKIVFAAYNIQVHKFQTRFFQGSKQYEPLIEQSDLVTYCLPYMLPKNISRQEQQTTKSRDLHAKG